MRRKDSSEWKRKKSFLTCFSSSVSVLGTLPFKLVVVPLLHVITSPLSSSFSLFSSSFSLLLLSHYFSLVPDQVRGKEEILIFEDPLIHWYHSLHWRISCSCLASFFLFLFFLLLVFFFLFSSSSSCFFLLLIPLNQLIWLYREGTSG